ncbi:hypothetical protein A2U01_0104419, partial [Trifolium medium]|nr:hypothetical protein [Trifolium medium]
NLSGEGNDDAVNDGENVAEAVSDEAVMLLSQHIMDEIVNDA